MPPFGRAARDGGLILLGMDLTDDVLGTPVFLRVVFGAIVAASDWNPSFSTDALRFARFLGVLVVGEASAVEALAPALGVRSSAAELAADTGLGSALAA